ncbi:MAG: (2Fe-2S)-binding protein [Kiritimatiellae bacterium]|jgi:[NiFe] hydrogenase diaphorase moiety small subunit|nr:(2Fe-2S)-binding protein [Kiritimatiellia bacterium]NLD89572.1 NADP oxidoreductase [Lentisphaerota bacterium]HPC20454.1 2Fe-2S iron-sulfur cluster-binding protein [Kiritimatiellia bacterium]HQN80068.1 2Fe-2S iron-sulfur cluster-binding protein [Kiritimatiellia bacterium]HQQ60445.1 2Fe-2S iron-sulfur cluster-binding protein [Kiritimatiellia bacterium]
MASFVRFTLDGRACLAEEGAQLVAAAKECGVYIPTLCNYPGIPPKGACRICTVLVNGIPQTACTTKVVEDMAVVTRTPELEEFRKAVVEILFAEGNHLCPSCERSGNCELQALAYRYRVTVPHFPYLFPKRDVEAWHPKLVKDHNRCIQCKRCIRGIHNAEGKAIFAFGKRGDKVVINIDPETSKNISDELAQRAMDICPVGAILRKGKGFDTPIGRRKYDHQPIGSEVQA